ncbi:MAG: glycosyl transferase family 1 [Candidatus Amulumruptor caecigallinarius]|uniref:Glycosyltransferase n=1 Tax=Candidatus Amulumruptor caecigallinarius TaxID=2109911 RepID=A0A4V1LAJ2_9BACT|nr:MAG: glycosyl transferase family 1 [Candidatus Amulumruptor caecigallinarius]HJE39140.1 glycosyltransferase [Candidatus Amulumruptor caecigallinarius]
MSNPKVSVIVPNYNYSRYLEQRMDSILGQTYDEMEIIILDDCSTDDSRKIIEKYRGNPKVTGIIYNNECSGSPFKQWEKGISISRGEYIWIAEADDVADADFLHHTVNILDRRSDVTVAYALSRLIDSSGKEIRNHIEDTVYSPFSPPKASGEAVVYDGASYFASRLIAHNVIYNASMALFRAVTFRRLDIRLYGKLRYIGDWAFWSEMSLKGNIAEVRLRLNSFRQHQASTTHISLSDRREALQREEDAFGHTFSPIATRILSQQADCSLYMPSYNTYLRRYNPARHKKRRYIKHLVSSFLKAATGRDAPIPPLSYLISISSPSILAIIPPKK